MTSAREDYSDVGTTDVADLPPDPAQRWRLMDDVELMQLPDPSFLVRGVLPEASVGALIAPPGLGKTTLAADLAFSLATGAPWFGHDIIAQGSTIYMAAEDPSGFKQRLRARKLAGHVSLDTRLGVYLFPDAVDMRDAGMVRRFSDFLARAFELGDRPRRLLVVDTYASANAGIAENSSEDTTAVMAQAGRWRDEHGVTVLLIHHTNAAGTRERGHSAMRGACDFMFSLQQNDDVIELENSKQRNGAPFPTIKLRLIPEASGAGMVFRLASDVLPGDELSPTQAKALLVLTDTFGPDGATKSEWQRTCADISERSFFRATRELQDRRLVAKQGERFYAVSKAPGLAASMPASRAAATWGTGRASRGRP